MYTIRCRIEFVVRFCASLPPWCLTKLLRLRIERGRQSVVHLFYVWRQLFSPRQQKQRGTRQHHHYGEYVFVGELDASPSKLDFTYISISIDIFPSSRRLCVMLRHTHTHTAHALVPMVAHDTGRKEHRAICWQTKVENRRLATGTHNERA